MRKMDSITSLELDDKEHKQIVLVDKSSLSFFLFNKKILQVTNYLKLVNKQRNHNSYKKHKINTNIKEK